MVQVSTDQIITRVDHQASQLSNLTTETRDCVRQQSYEQRLILDLFMDIANQQAVFLQATNLSTQSRKATALSSSSPQYSRSRPTFTNWQRSPTSRVKLFVHPVLRTETYFNFVLS